MSSENDTSELPPFTFTPSPQQSPSYQIEKADAFDLPLTADSVEVVVTSPPYWQKRDYGFTGQIGQEETSEEYIDRLMSVLDECARVLRPDGTAFVNIGDTFRDRSLVGIPRQFAVAAQKSGWTIRNEITWVKTGGVPDPADNRLARRTESVFFLVRDADNYYHDRFGYRAQYGKTGDVWEIDMEPDDSSHLAPFPSALVQRALVFGCPPLVCTHCGQPFEREVEPSFLLDEDRSQARRAMEQYRDSDLEREHLEAVRSVGLGEVGKTSEVQTGTGCNADEVERLAEEARDVLGSYAREFVQPDRESLGWKPTCDASCERVSGEMDSAEVVTDSDATVPGTRPGVVLDPFVGTGTTAEEAGQYGLSAIGTDLSPPSNFQLPLRAQF